MPASTEEQTVQRWLEAWNGHNIQEIISLYAEDYQGLDVGESASHRGRDGIRRLAGRYLHGFPDLLLTVQDVFYEAGRTAICCRARGTHLGHILHIPPTGNQVEVLTMTMLKVQDGLIKEGIYIWDMAGMLRQIGLLTALPRED